MNLNTESSDLKMNLYLMLTMFYFFNWVQFLARAIFTTGFFFSVLRGNRYQRIISGNSKICE